MNIFNIIFPSWKWYYAPCARSCEKNGRRWLHKQPPRWSRLQLLTSHIYSICNTWKWYHSNERAGLSTLQKEREWTSPNMYDKMIYPRSTFPPLIPCIASSNRVETGTSGSGELLSALHWGQRGSYLAGTLRIFWEFLNNLLTLYPAGKLRVLLKLTHHFDLNVIGG